MPEELDKELETMKEDETEEETQESAALGEGKEPEPKKETKKEKSSDIDEWKKSYEAEVREKIRKEEKDKLYKSFEKYKEDAKAAEEARKSAETKLQEYETSKLTAEEQATLKLTQLEEMNKKMQEQMESLVDEANSKINTLQIELVKKEVLGKYGDEIIPALVTGNTIEEITESAEKAHREYVSIRDQAIAKSKETSKARSNIGTGISPPSDKLNAGVNVADINKISDPKVWEANRDKFLEEALKPR